MFQEGVLEGIIKFFSNISETSVVWLETLVGYSKHNRM